ncbi:hypothetical protein [Chryseobacterium sp. Leaf394]|uniref:hypothetical protein n=1 Tax=Chryseobacterium sp. Leaf394 TaxID=1736361 RepID=UPI0006F2CC0B|nr:hypothetical protein [Chryseobacterium sp. Leaf394]KQS92880.1 hypothetical protein ASG21_10725 [Chryseobacterium sp. Leaf394]
MTNRSTYFKITFIPISAGLFAGILVFGLFDIDFSDTKALKNLLLKSLVIAVGTGLILSILNMFLKIGNLQKK